jgi:phenylacetate-CoA ligase
VPVLDKETIREHSKELLSDEFEISKLRKHSTSGSTGDPISVYLSKEENGLGVAGNQFFMDKVGGKLGSRISTLYGGDLDVSKNPSFFRKLKDWLLNLNNYGCFWLDDDYLLKVHKGFDSFQPDILIGYTSGIYMLANTLQKSAIRPDYPAETIIVAAEKLEDYQREKIENIFTAPVIERYGSRDAGLIGYQKINDHKIWIDAWDYFIEPEELPDSNNQAPILVTRLHTKAMPILRYRIGDIAKFPATWSCSTPVLYLEEIVGRVLDNLHFPGNITMHGGGIPYLFQEYDVVLYQVVQDESGNIKILIVPGEKFTVDQRDAFEYFIHENIQGVKIQVEYVTQIERNSQNKHRPVISYYRSNL